MSDDHPLASLIPDQVAANGLAERVGCSVAHLRNIRAGRKSASLRLAKRLSEATGISMESFLRPEPAE